MNIPSQLRPFPLLNVNPNGKDPAEDHGVNSARVGRAIEPGNNYGVVGGAGLLFVDCDNHKETEPGVANFQKLVDKHGCPETFSVETPSGGCHLYFLLPPGKSYASGNGVLAPGVDIKCEGGYVVGPGSVRDGKAYTVACDAPVAYAPEWLLKLLDLKSRPKEKTIAAPVSEEVLLRRKGCAEKLLGSIQWESPTVGNCTCPGEAKHTNKTGDSHCQVYLDGAPTVFCLHSSCAEEVEAANLALRKACSEATPDVLASFYYDATNKSYWSSGSNIGWQNIGVDALRQELALKGISPDRNHKAGELISPADKAMVTLRKRRSVDGVFPGFFRVDEVIVHNNMHLLNTSRLRVLNPHPDNHAEGGGFPWLDQYLTDLLGERQRMIALAWLAHFYRSALNHRPVRGLALFLAGPVGGGKSFFTNFVMKRIFGRVEEATHFLCGEDQFNSNLFESPVWNVDDAAGSVDAKTHARFSAAVKAAVANDEMMMRAMYRAGIKMPWSGRLVVTMNDDPESIRLLPHGEGSMTDKYILLKSKFTYEKFPEDDAIVGELPHFCAHLRDMPCDPAVWVGGRFGVLAWQNPELMGSAVQESNTYSVVELCQAWAKIHFDGTQTTEWEGTPTQLLSELGQRDSGFAEITRSLKLSTTTLGRALNKAILAKTPGVSKVSGRSKGRFYRITRDILREDGS